MFSVFALDKLEENRTPKKNRRARNAGGQRGSLLIEKGWGLAGFTELESQRGKEVLIFVVLNEKEIKSTSSHRVVSSLNSN